MGGEEVGRHKKGRRCSLEPKKAAAAAVRLARERDRTGEVGGWCGSGEERV